MPHRHPPFSRCRFERSALLCAYHPIIRMTICTDVGSRGVVPATSFRLVCIDTNLVVEVAGLTFIPQAEEWAMPAPKTRLGNMTANHDYSVYEGLTGKTILISGGVSVRRWPRQSPAIGRRWTFSTSAARLGETLAASTPLATFHACDLRDITGLRVAVTDIELLDGAICLLINNAGSDARHAMEVAEPSYWRDRLAFNLDHRLSASQAVAGRMKERGSSTITMTSSNIMDQKPAGYGRTYDLQGGSGRAYPHACGLTGDECHPSQRLRGGSDSDRTTGGALAHTGP
jgi:hypothetical protein